MAVPGDPRARRCAPRGSRCRGFKQRRSQFDRRACCETTRRETRDCARARNEWARWKEGVRYGMLGVDVVINPRVLVATELARIARSYGASDVVEISQGRLELVQIELDESRLLNRPLASLDLPKDIVIAAIVRDGELFVPGEADVIMRDDRLYLIGAPQQLLSAEALFSKEREAKRVCIVGGGVVGRALVRELLKHNATMMVIERNRETAESLKAEFSEIQVVHGDGTDRELLEEEEVGTFDLFAAVTSQDEINLMASLLAQRAGAKRTAAIVQRADYTQIYKQLGIDIVLSPLTVASDHMLRFSRGGRLHGLTVLEGGQAEVVELTAAPGSRAAEKTVGRLGLPRGSIVAAIIHGERTIIASHDDVIHPGDRVILVTTFEARNTIERIFRPRNA
ncbi:MAG: Trk system potassium transporter TrkA [Polyangiales bacterium]